MDLRSLKRPIVPGLVSAAAGLAAHLVWTDPLISVLAAATGSVAGALAIQRPEEFLPRASGALAAGATDRPARGGVALPSGVGQLLLEHLPMGVLLIDAEGRVLLINAAAIGILGRRPPGVFHSSALRAPRLLDAIETSIDGGVSASVDFTLSRGTDLHLRGHVRPLSGRLALSDDTPRAAVMVLIEDITGQSRADELHRDFVANASHELKTPLSSISGIIETLQGHARDDPEATRRFFAMLASQTERMKRLVDDLLSLNRIELNERVQPTRPQRLRDLVGEVAEAMAPIAREAGQTLDVTLPEPETIVPGSFEELSQALRNLIDNAIKYGRRGGRVTIELEAPDPHRPGMVGLAVADDGPGIAREHLPRLTERFYRVSISGSRARGGTGLGLAIVKHVVNRHRGELSVESTLGEGSRFTVWLPRSTSEARPATGRGAARHDNRFRTVADAGPAAREAPGTDAGTPRESLDMPKA